MQWQHPGPLQEVRLLLRKTQVNARLRRPSPLPRRLQSPQWRSTGMLQRRKFKRRKKMLLQQLQSVVDIGSANESKQHLPRLSPLTLTPGK